MLLNFLCICLFFIHLKLELLTQFPASSEWKIILFMINRHIVYRSTLWAEYFILLKIVYFAVFYLVISNMTQRHVAFCERHVAFCKRHVVFCERHVAFCERHVAFCEHHVALFERHVTPSLAPCSFVSATSPFVRFSVADRRRDWEK